MARLGTWGDHLTLQAWQVGRRVVVFERAPDDTMRVTVLWPGEAGKAGDPVLDERDVKLSSTGSHYRAGRKIRRCKGRDRFCEVCTKRGVRH
ncbi:hypothetical protein DIPPA_05783 [Diplonema papillatum]|nr:hypothetical protein DIPPA_05783 [Diplonema papillatum]